MLRRRWIIALLSFALLAAGLTGAPAQGQSPATQATRDVSGRVTMADVDQPLPGASITRAGQSRGALTNERGQFRLAVPAGSDVVLLVRAIGFTRREVRVAAGQSSINVALSKDVLKLEGVSVTGAATTVDRRNAATAVAVVTGEELTRVPAPSLESQLQGKLVGANINMNSGAPGGGGQIQIRGPTSVLGRADPLFVIDGVLIDNSGTSTGINSVTGASGRGTNITNSAQDNTVNRLADINPNDIEDLQVLKGAAASAIYGSKATNGVIVITTKRGRAGATAYRALQRVGQNALQSTLPSRHFPNRQAALDAAGTNPDALARVNAAFDANASPYIDNVAKLYDQADLSYESVLSASGGTDRTRYFVAGSQKRDGGTQRNTEARLQSLRVNLDQTLGSRVTVGLSTVFTRNRAARGISGNDNAQISPLYVFAYAPGVIDLDQKDAQGNYVTNPFAGGGLRISNPFQTLDALVNLDETNRQIGGLNVRYNALATDRNTVALSFVGGIDRYDQNLNTYLPNYIQNEGADGYRGRVVQGSAASRLLNTSLNAVWTFTPQSHLFQSSASAGSQLEQRDNNIFYVRARGLLPGTDYINQGNPTISQSRLLVRDQALYAQEQIVVRERLLLSARVRAERGSANGDRATYYMFPAFAGSYRFTPPVPGADEIKLRAAVGTSGNQPRYGDRDLTLNAVGAIGGQNAVGTAATLGNPTIRPERMTEQEFGVDGSFLQQRLGVVATYFNRNIRDLLLAAPLAPTAGLGSQVINGGRLATDGFELSLTAEPIKRRGFAWTSLTNWYTYKSIIRESAVPPFNVPNSGFGAEYGRARWVQGYRSTLIWGNRRHADGTIVDTVLGDAAPRFTMGFTNTFTMGPVGLNVVVDYRKGGSVSDMTQSIYDDGKNSYDYDAAAPNGDPRPLGLYRSQERTNGNSTVLIQDGSYVKLREVTLSWQAPRALAARIPHATDLRVSASGRNLLISTPYWGLDPEVSNFGNQNISRFVDLTIYPPSRSFFFSVDVGF